MVNIFALLSCPTRIALKPELWRLLSLIGMSFHGKFLLFVPDVKLLSIAQLAEPVR